MYFLENKTSSMIGIYTLEKHLAEVCKINTEFKILNSIWTLNKPKLTQALNTVEHTFTQYSLHDGSHSQTIIKNIEAFLGEKRIKNLSPTDTWLILMASFTHDLGMVVFYDNVEKLWKSEKFKEFLNEIKNSHRDPDLKTAAEEIDNLRNENTDNSKVSPLDVKRWVSLLNSEYFRRVHPQRSKDMLQGRASEDFNNLIQKYYSDQIPNRFLVLLGEIAYSHGANFDFILNRLEFQANGLQNDKIHPRLIACLLRLGDLLDVDDNRFNPFTAKVFYHNLTKISQRHKEKHASVRHLQISPRSIEVTVDCNDDKVYRIARQWFDWLEQEVDLQRKHWTLIAPEELGGLSPTIEEGKIKILLKGAITKKELMNLRFQMPSEKVFEMLEGGGIYDNPKEVFIREVIQNAYDASKIQLWKDILSGIYDFVLIDHLDLDKNLKTSEIIKHIKFPDDIPDNILKNYPIEFDVEWVDEKKKELIKFTFRDYGTGISEDTLIRMTSQVGVSRKKDKEYKKLKTIPYWLKPTGAFGIGLQSIFFVTDNFEATTSIDGINSQKITFRSSKKGEYSTVEISDASMKRGTKIIIITHRSNFSFYKYQSTKKDLTLSQTIFNKQEALFFDLDKLQYQILLRFKNISNLKSIKKKLPSLKNIEGKIFLDQQDNTPQLFKISEDNTLENMKVHLLMDEQKQQFQFRIYEAFLGSTIDITFASLIFLINNYGYNSDRIYVVGEFTNHRDKGMTSFLVRDIHIDDEELNNMFGNSSGLLSYISRININLMNKSSDQLLNLARTKLLRNSNLFKDITEILKLSIPLIYQLITKNIHLNRNLNLYEKFSHNYNELQDYSDKDIVKIHNNELILLEHNYFIIYYLNLLHNDVHSNLSKIEEIDYLYFPFWSIISSSGNLIKLSNFKKIKKFWQVKDLLTNIPWTYSNMRETINIEDKYTILEVYKDTQTSNLSNKYDTALVNCISFFTPYLHKYCYIKKIIFSKKYASFLCLYHKKNKFELDEWIEFDKIAKVKYLSMFKKSNSKLYFRIFTLNYYTLLPIKDYKKIIIDHDKTFSYYFYYNDIKSNYSIVLPIIEFLQEGITEIQIKEQIEKILKKDFLEKIQSLSVINPPVSLEEIKATYFRLYMDIWNS